MKPTKPRAPQWLKTYTIRTFQLSNRKSLLLTGSKGIGKTTLFNALTKGCTLPGVTSCAIRGEDGLPFSIELSDRLDGKSVIIGKRKAGQRMQAVQSALDGAGAAMLRSACSAKGEWAVIDEIGFLEEASDAYKKALLQLFDQKRVLAVLRKADTDLLCALRARDDCLVLDLDEAEGWRA